MKKAIGLMSGLLAMSLHAAPNMFFIRAARADALLAELRAWRVKDPGPNVKANDKTTA